MSTTVIVSGANGYIAQHIVSQLVNKGYKVVGTVRSTNKGEQLKKNLKSDNFSYEIVGAIEKEGAFDEVLKNHTEASIFLHTASPVIYTANDVEKEIIFPAINGTKNALSAIKKYGSHIKRVVVTSSALAHINLADPVITEESWNPITWEEAKQNGQTGYRGSKTFAEKEAWDFVKNEKVGFDLTTVSPSVVFGPQAFDENVKGTLNHPAKIVDSLLKLNPESTIPAIASHFVDVRDAAKAHLVAFELDSTKSQRLIVSSGKFTSQATLDIILKNFTSLQGKLPVGNAGEDPEKIVPILVDNTKTRNILGYNLASLEKTTIDTVEQVLKVNGQL